MGLFNKKEFTKADDSLRHWTATIAHIQLSIGIWIYFISPNIKYFLNYYHEAVKEKEIRFFGMEHSVMMLLAVIVITIGSMKAKRKKISHDKFKTILIYFTIALLIILISIPWPFSPLASRPLFPSF